MSKTVKQLALLNLATLLVGTSGILGRQISLSADYNIFLRCIIASIAIYVIIRFRKSDIRIKGKKSLFKILISGTLLCTHWVTYFISLKVSSVAIGMISLFSFPVFTALLEPFFFKSKLSWLALFNSILVLAGIYFLVPEFDADNNNTQGVLWGLFSALCYALRNLLNKGLIQKHDSLVIMFYQVSISAILLTYTLFAAENSLPIPADWALLAFLGIVTTSIGHTLFVHSLNHFSTSTASIVSSTQPIYGIILAVIFLGEIPNYSVYIGGALILSTVLFHSIYEVMKNQKSN